MKFVLSQIPKNEFLGHKNSQAGSTLRTALFGNDKYKYKENGDEYPIILEFEKQYKKQSMFDSVYVNSQKVWLRFRNWEH